MRLIPSEVLPEAQTIPVAILNVEISTTVMLIADVADDLYALRLELGSKRISVVDPNIGIPGCSFGIDKTVRSHHASLFERASMMTTPFTTQTTP
jgi:hypothetical protein